MATTLRDENGLNEAEFLSAYDPAAFDRLSLSVDMVVFGVNVKPVEENFRKLDEQKLTVLLVKRTGHPSLGLRALPGGFVRIEEPLEAAARRVLKTKTGLDDLYLEQLGTFGDPQRDPRMRIVSTAYLSLIDRSRYRLGTRQPDDPTWFEVELAAEAEELVLSKEGETMRIPVASRTVRNGRIPARAYSTGKDSPLAFDHAKLILEGLLRLRGKIDYTDIAFNLVPEKFTISQLRQIYEIVLDQEILSPVFRRKIASKIEGCGGYTHDKGHRPSQLFIYKGQTAMKKGGCTK